MKSLVEELLEYFNNTSEEQIKKDWEAIHKEYSYGMEVQKFIESSKKLLTNGIVVSPVKANSAVSEDFGNDINLSMAA